MTYQLNRTKTVNIGTTYPDYRKWEILKFNSTGSKSIVIRINSAGIGSTTYTMHPYKEHNKKWKHWIWFNWLKIKVRIGDLYIN